LVKGGVLRKRPPFKKTRTCNWFSRNDIMIIYFSVILKELFILGRDYPWPKPDRCPRCNSCKLWGHGFVLTLFDGYNRPLFLKRYRCPACKCVIRLRPHCCFKRFQATMETIRSSISYN
jgi:hypothetical protein